MNFTCSHCGKPNISDKRTNQQNRYLHLVIGVIADHLGYTHAEMKQLLKEKFGLYETGVNKKTGEEFKIYTSTAKLNKKDFASFTEKILILANSNGINILTPEEYFSK